MRLRVAKRVLWGGSKFGFRRKHRLGTIHRARQRMRRHVGPLPPAWDGIELAVNRAKRWTYLLNHRFDNFCTTHDTVMKALGYPFGRSEATLPISPKEEET